MAAVTLTSETSAVQSLEKLASPEQIKFISGLIAQANDVVSKDVNLESKGIKQEDVQQFLTSLATGHAEKKGTDLECRPVCVCAQGAIEEALTQSLKSGEIKEVVSVVLTPLPTSPLRKKGDTDGMTSEPFGPDRQYTLDMREITVRNLREAGATIVAAYEKENYESFCTKEDAASKQQCATYEEEKLHERTVDMPLTEAVPQELVGALYLITDKDGNTYYLATQGVQAMDAKPAHWQKWFAPAGVEDHDAVKRARAMLAFIENNGGEKTSAETYALT